MKVSISIHSTILTALFMVYSSGSLFAITAKEIIAKSDRKIRGNTQIARFEITIKARRWKRTLKMKSYQNRLKKKSFSVINEPRKDAGNRFLLIDKNMWHYQPRIQRVIKISPSMMLDSWMGSDFTNDDIVKESSIVKDYTHSIIGEETVDSHRCYKIKLSPKPEAAVVWGKIIYYARKSDYLPVREEFYNEHSVLKKVMTFSSFKRMHDRVIPTLYKMITVKKRNRYTLMLIKRVKFNIKIPAGIFSVQHLKRR